MNLVVAGAFALVVAGACSEEDEPEAGTGGHGGNAGSGVQPTGGVSGKGGTSAGKGGTGGKGGASGKGGTSGGSGGQSGEGGASEPNGGGAGDAQSGNGPTGDDEPTPRDVCETIICAPDHQIGDFGDDFCPAPPGGDGGASGAGRGASGAAGAPGYDRDACMETCLVYDEVNVPARCGDESFLYWTCLANPFNYVCEPTGGTEENLCHQQQLMLYLCIEAFSRAEESR